MRKEQNTDTSNNHCPTAKETKNLIAIQSARMYLQNSLNAIMQTMSYMYMGMNLKGSKDHQNY